MKLSHLSLSIALAATTMHAHAIVGRNLGERQVNVSTAGEQLSSTFINKYMGLSASGTGVVAYTSSTGDGSGTRVLFRRFGTDTSWSGGEVQANETTSGNQGLPVVGVRLNGDFVVVWMGNGPGDPEGIFARLYSADGDALSPEFRVNTNTTVGGTPSDDRAWPSVAVAPDGSFVVSWSWDDANLRGVWFRKFAADGTPLSGEVRANTTTVDQQRRSVVAMDDFGNFVVTWYGIYINGSSDDIVARLFGPTGTPLTGEIRVNSITAGDQQFQTVDMAPDGRFVVAWNSADGDVHARTFDAAGSPTSAEFTANTYTNNLQVSPVVAVEDDGSFTIVWASDRQDGSGLGIYGQRFHADATPDGCEFHVSTTTASAQEIPAIATMGDGKRMVVAWTSNLQDGSGRGVFAQFLDEPKVTPDRIGAPLGSSFQLSVPTLESGLEYVWKKDGADVTTNTLPQLTINNFTRADSGYYTCEITDNCTTQTITAIGSSIFLRPAVTLVQEPSDLTVSVGDPATFTAQGVGGTVEYQWYRDDKMLIDDGRIEGTTTGQLRILSALKSDEGGYRCDVSNQAGIVPTRDATLTVIAPVSIWQIE